VLLYLAQVIADCHIAIKFKIKPEKARRVIRGKKETDKNSL